MPAACRKKTPAAPTTAPLLEAHAGAAAFHRERRGRGAGAPPAVRLQPCRRPSRPTSKPSSSMPDTCSARPTPGSSAATATARRSLFGGDLGRYDRPILPDPSPGVACDVLLLESTYGDRAHPPMTTARSWRGSSTRRPIASGKLIVPAFAIGRVEEVLYWLKKLEGERPGSGAAGLRGQPDGGAGARVLPAACGRSWTRMSGRRAARCRAFCTARFEPVASSRESQAVVDGRVRASSSRRAAWPPAAAFSITWPRGCPIRGTPCCSSASRRPARAAAT